VAAMPSGDKRRPTDWRKARARVVVPICLIVAVAVLCIVLAVMTSARRADEVALAHDKNVFTRALGNYGARMLREVESAAATPSAIEHIQRNFDRPWVQQRVGLWLQGNFKHDFVFVIDAKENLIYALLGRRSVDPAWFNSVRPSLEPMLDVLRGRSHGAPKGTVRIAATDIANAARPARAALVQSFVGRPAILAAVAVGAPSQAAAAAEPAPAVLSVKLIDKDMLRDLGTELQLRNLRPLDGPVPKGDTVFDLTDGHGRSIGRFAWTPVRSGAEIITSVLPFIAGAVGAFMLLVGLMMRFMRRTAATIAAGEMRMRHLALHDPLCGLPNRIFFGERLESVIEEVRGGGAPAAVFYIDLDHFKEVNDTLGHPIGDELIRNVTLRLSRTLRGDDLVARLGGDEFAVITTCGPDTHSLQMIAGRILTALCAPYAISDQTIVIGASIGIAVVDGRAEAAADIMRYADMALYRAKNEGRNRACIYDAAMDADLSSRKLLERDLREAIENGQLQVVYQPIVNASGETIVGVEALARWTHCQRGEVPPAEFIPVAEHSGLIFAVGEFVLRQACLDGKAWPEFTVSVNVSPLQFRRVEFVEIVERILNETGFDPARLELEVTESTLLGNVDAAEAAMLRLKAIGVRLALDDFGTGYSSLQYLRRFPFDKLKIDGSFVRSIDNGADAAAIIHAVVSLGRGLRMKVTAEGVETAEQHLFLRAAGVHTMQGYRFGKPCSAAEFEASLKTGGPHRPITDDPEIALAG
jgi:diguanylate cyclase (GGDEF)-like protein